MSARVYIALLRAINVGGRNPVPMKDLRTIVEATGADEVETYLQSGNVVLRSTVAHPERMARAIEDGIRSQLGQQIAVMVRAAEEMDRVVAANPLGSHEWDRSRLHVTFLAAVPESRRVSALEAAAEAAADAGSGDVFRIRPREVYLYCPNGYGRTKLNNSFFERKLAVAATTRNWRTVVTLAEMARR